MQRLTANGFMCYGNWRRKLKSNINKETVYTKDMRDLLSKQIKKVVLSPHYDDFPLSMGGLALKWAKKKCRVEDHIVFSRSNYLTDDYKGGKDRSPQRVLTVSSIRLKEETNATKRMGNVRILLWGKDEALVRGHTLSKLLCPSLVHAKKIDLELLVQIQKKIKLLLRQPIQLFAPLALQRHIDHLILREALAATLGKGKAQVFFYEDLPYAADANKKEWKHTTQFITGHHLKPILIPIDLTRKLELLDFYNSQTEPGYYKGVKKWAEHIRKHGKKKTPCERIYLFSS